MDRKRISKNEYEEKHFGKVLAMNEIDDSFATTFAEGSPALEKLLLSMWHSGLSTRACCRGHLLRPLFVKKVLWMKKYITEEEYVKNMYKPNYYRMITNQSAYISFFYSSDDMMKAAHALRDRIQERFPEIKFSVSFGHDCISIHVEEHLMPKYVEIFFTGLMEILPEWQKDF
jgi:hydroxymethylpyrimidine pyrophosphatase-like HAD family hydrolase